MSVELTIGPGDELWLGTTDGLWPVQAFTTEEHAIGWLVGCDSEGRKRHAWRVRLRSAFEVTVVASKPYLTPVNDVAPPGEATS